MRKLEALGFGALGGMCPTLAKLAGSYTANPVQDMPALGVYIGIGLFAILGGIVALGFGTQELRAAIVAGIAAPAIVTNVISGVSDKNPQSQQTALYEIVGTAHAQSDAGAILLAQASDTIITVVPSVSGGDPSQVEPLRYTWSDATGQISSGGGVLNPAAEQALSIPEGAEALIVNGERIDLSAVPQDGATLDLLVTAKPTIGGDLRWALGGNRQLAVQSLQGQIVQSSE